MNRTEKQISRAVEQAVETAMPKAVERALETAMPKVIEQAMGVLSLEKISTMSFEEIDNREVV